MSRRENTEYRDNHSAYHIARGQYFRLLPFQVLLIAVSAVNGIVDSIVASNLIGKEAMTAIGMFGPVNHFLYAASIMLVSGSQILCGKYMGENRDRELKNVFSVDLITACVLSVIIALVLAAGAAMNMAGAMVPTAEEAAALNAYFLGQAIGIPGLVIGQQLFAFLSLENRTGRTTAASVVCVIVNIGLDLVFVAAFPLGCFGLALASSLSVWAFFGVMAVYYLSGKSAMKFRIKGPRFGEVKNIVRLGYPGSVSRFAEMIRCLIVNALILTCVGSVGLSSFAASNAVLAIFWALPFGMMAVTRMQLSISIGAEDRKNTEVNMRVAHKWGIGIMCVVAALIILFAVPLTQLFYHDPGDPVYGMTVMALRLLPVCMPLAIVSTAFCCYYQTMEKKTASVLLAVMDGVVFVAAFSLILIPSFKMNGLYLANILNGICCILLVVLFSAKDRKRFPKTFKDLLAMPKDFGAEEGEELSFSVRSVEDAVTVSRKIRTFCLGKGVDQRRSMLAGLAMEEMAGNVVEHGFSKDSRHHSVDIRVTCKDEDAILCVRDNCVPFDPSDRAKITDPEDGVKNVGLKILMG